MRISNETYDRLKWVAQYLLPGLATLYFALTQIWGFPYGDEIVLSVMAIDSALGFVLGMGNKQYQADVKSLGGQLLKRSAALDIKTFPTQERRTGLIIKMTEETYDILMFFTQYLLPSIGTITVALSPIWGFQYGDQVIGTIAAIDTFMGIFLGISNAQYKVEISQIEAARQAMERTSE
jgi:hypothetical protein